MVRSAVLTIGSLVVGSLVMAPTVLMAQDDKPGTLKVDDNSAKVEVEAVDEAQTKEYVDLQKLTPVQGSDMVLKKVPEVTEEKPMSFWMRHKLEYSKRILESLTLGDHEKVALYARQLRTLGKIEGFVRRKNPEYRKQQKAFDYSLRLLIQHAETPDPTQATLAFSKLATTCVNCHTVLRNETVAADPSANSSQP